MKRAGINSLPMIFPCAFMQYLPAVCPTIKIWGCKFEFYYFLFQAVVANMISIFCKMTPRHYDQYIEHFRADKPAGRCDLVTISF